MTILKYDDETHSYFLDDQPVPSVTQILAPLVNFDGIPAATLERKRKIGTLLHETVARDWFQETDLNLLDDDVEPYFVGWRKFRCSYGQTLDLSGFETPLASTLYRYAGTPDFWGIFEGQPAVFDIKTSVALSPTVGLQLAGYRQLLAEHDGEKWKNARLFAVQVGKNRKFTLREYNASTDFFVFLACLQIYHWREENDV